MTSFLRLAQSDYRLAERIFKAVAVTGVRGCGKSTFVRGLLPADAAIVSLECEAVRRELDASPCGFLEQNRGRCLAFDEVQRIPKLFDAMKAFADESPETRQYVLTASANFRSMSSVRESMAGRLGEVRLRTLTETEIQGRNSCFVDRILAGNFDESLMSSDCSLEVILQKAYRGGFPEALGLEKAQRSQWFEVYVNNLALYELPQLGEYRKPQYLRLLLEQSAARSGRPLNVSAMSAAMQVNRPTVMQYLNALETFFLVDIIPVWRGPIWKKPALKHAARTSKLMLCDSGLAAWFLGGDDRERLETVIQTWIYQQLVTMADIGKRWKLSYWRDAWGRQIDFVLENREGDLICLVVRPEESVLDADFADLRHFREQVGKDFRVWSIVLYAGREVKCYGEGEIALPMAYLWL